LKKAKGTDRSNKNTGAKRRFFHGIKKEREKNKSLKL
jgi:hypothetical protein